MSNQEWAESLAEQAVSNRVTADQLLGHEKYYPDILSVLQEWEQPHHVALLTVNSNLQVNTGDRWKDHSTDDTALVATKRHMRIISDEMSVIEPYNLITEVWWEDDGSKRDFEISIGEHSQKWSHNEALSADSQQFEDTILFIKEMAESKSFGYEIEATGEKPLRKQHKDGEISDAEFILRREQPSEQS